MPGSEGLSQNWKPLPTFKPGDLVTIRRIHEFLEDDQDLMKFLEENKVTPGAVGEIREILPFNCTFSMSIDNHKVILGLDVANSIFAEPV